MKSDLFRMDFYGGTQEDAALFGPAGRVPLDGVKDPWHYIWIKHSLHSTVPVSGR